MLKYIFWLGAISLFIQVIMALFDFDQDARNSALLYIHSIFTYFYIKEEWKK